MNNYCLTFTKLDSDESFRQFANEIDGRTNDADDEIRTTGKIAKGLIKKIHLDAGFYMRTWHLQFSQQVCLYKEALPANIPSNIFSFFYIFTPASCILKTIGDHQQFSRNDARHSLLISDSVNAEFEIIPFLPVKIVELSITGYSLLKQLEEANMQQGAINGILENQLPLVISETAHSRLFAISDSLFENSLIEDPKIARLYMDASKLLTGLVDKGLRNEDASKRQNTDVYYTKISEAESVLRKYLYSQLPPLSAIAKELALSESTLKRHFKTIFGKSIYEYYLQKKMELARELLLEKPAHVNEIADTLGYEKASSFINIFKKYHGFSPGRIRKMKS